MMLAPSVTRADGFGPARGRGAGRRLQVTAGIVALVHAPDHAGPAPAREPDDRPLAADVQLAAAHVLGEEGVQLGQQARPEPEPTQGAGLREQYPFGRLSYFATELSSRRDRRAARSTAC
jgi:hypothetical protein